MNHLYIGNNYFCLFFPFNIIASLQKFDNFVLNQYKFLIRFQFDCFIIGLFEFQKFHSSNLNFSFTQFKRIGKKEFLLKNT